MCVMWNNGSAGMPGNEDVAVDEEIPGIFAHRRATLRRRRKASLSPREGNVVGPKLTEMISMEVGELDVLRYGKRYQDHVWNGC